MFEDFTLKVFLVAADEGSFTRAAKRLDITQPAVSQKVAELEKTFGVKLFERRKGQTVLTPEGHVFRDYAASISDSYAEMKAIFSDFASFQAIKVIKLAIAPEVMAQTTAQLVPYITSVCPGASVAVMAAPREGADLQVFADGSVQASPAFSATPLYPLLMKKILNR